MQIYKMDRHIVAAETEDEARRFYLEEFGATAASVEELSVSTLFPAGDGTQAAGKDLVNKVMDERSAWLKMGIPCDKYYPFVIAKL